MAKVELVDGLYQISYQPKNPKTGEPVGPPQLFKDKTVEGVLEKVAAAHESAAVAFYGARQQVKLERVMNPDQGRPIRQFSSRPLTADERVHIQNLRKDPNKSIEATQIEIEALLGAPLADIQAQLNEHETERIAAFATAAVNDFLEAHPEYIECDTNKEAMESYLLKNELAVTPRNLEIAFDAQSEANKLALREPKSTPESEPTVELPAATNSGEPASSASTPISVTAAPAPRIASSALSARGSSAPQTPAATPQPVGLTHRDLANMSAAEYAAKLNDPDFVKQVDALTPRK